MFRPLGDSIYSSMLNQVKQTQFKSNHVISAW